MNMYIKFGPDYPAVWLTIRNIHTDTHTHNDKYMYMICQYYRNKNVCFYQVWSLPKF